MIGWSVNFSQPARKLVDVFALFRQAVAGATPADDDDLHVRLQLFDIRRRFRVCSIGAAADHFVRMRLRDFFGNAVGEVPNVVRQLPARAHLIDLFALAKIALTNRAVGIRRHDRDGVEVVDIELRPRPFHRFLKQLFIRVAKVIESLSRHGVALSRRRVRTIPASRF